jgi:hypothetical protein
VYDGSRLVAAGLCALLALACADVGCNPEGVRAGAWLRGAEARELVADWSFTRDAKEAFLETRAWWGRHSVTVWVVDVDGRLFVANDNRTRPKRWVANLDRDRRARIAIAGRVYPVRAQRVVDPALWDRVTARYPVKYAAEIGDYVDFPKPGERDTGEVFELRSEPTR